MIKLHSEEYWNLERIINECPVLLDSEKKQAIKYLNKGKITKYIKNRLEAYHLEKNLKEIKEIEKQKVYDIIDKI